MAPIFRRGCRTLLFNCESTTVSIHVTSMKKREMYQYVGSLEAVKHKAVLSSCCILAKPSLSARGLRERRRNKEAITFVFLTGAIVAVDSLLVLLNESAS